MIEDCISFKYKVMIIIAIVLILLESSIILVSVFNDMNHHYCYVDINNNLGDSYKCRRNQCSSSDSQLIYVNKYIKIK